jgi:hypothetical protein
MGKLSLLKRGCLGFVILFGFVFLGSMDSFASVTLVSGCTRIDVNNSGYPDQVGHIDRPECTNFDPSDPVDLNSAVIVNPNSVSIVGGMQNYTGVQPASPYSVTLVAPAYTASFLNIINPPGCKDFFGVTSDNPLVNQGLIDFDNEEPGGDYRTCLTRYMANVPAGELQYKIDGWAWNTNIGWFSMMAEDVGSGPENRGLSVGSVEYSSLVKVGNSYNGSGELFGFWWNDAAGWLKLNCAADTNLNSFDVANCASDGGADYGVYIDSFDLTTNRAILSGYAWSDAFGYVNFDGVQVSVPGLTPTYEAKVEYVKVNSQEEVYANSENGYKIRVSFYDGAKNMTTEFADSDFQNSFCLAYHDYRKLNKLVKTNGGVTNSNRSGNAPFYACGNASSQTAMEDDVRMNQLGWDGQGASTLMGAFADRFTLKGPLGREYFELNDEIVSMIPVDVGELKLRQVFMYNEISGLYKEDNSPDEVGALEFKEPYDLNILGGDVLSEADCKQGELLLEFDRPVLASICGEFYGGGGIGNLSTGIIGEPKINSAYSDKFDSITASADEQGKSAFGERGLVSQDGYGDTDLWLKVNLAQGVEVNEMEPLKSLLDLTIVSKVSYQLPSGATVYRYGPELSNDSQNIFELNIQGGLADRSFGSTAFSSGSKDTQGSSKGLKVKEMVYRVLRNIIKMDPKPGMCGQIELVNIQRDELGELLSGCGRVSSAGGRDVVFVGAREVQEGGIGGYVMYSELKELIDSQVSETGKHPVVVLYGMDLVIDESLIPTSVGKALDRGVGLTEMESELDQVSGFVVIESESGQGGEVIVSADVTDFVGYVYADGRMLSAPDLLTAVDAARGDADNVLNRGVINEDPLYNQLSFVGALYSSNCIGCASSSPALRADGSIAESRLLSLNDDLNAFRYTPLVFNIKSGTVKVDEKDQFGQDTGNQVDEPYTCLVPCGEDKATYNPMGSNGRFKNECANVESKITVQNACFDENKYAVNGGVNKLSLIEELLSGGKRGVINQLEKVERANPSNPNYGEIRSVSIRSLNVPEDMPVFGVISE